MFCMKCGLELPDDSQFCRKCGFAFPIAASQPSPTTTPVHEPESSTTLSSVPAMSTPPKPTLNFGTFVFAGFSALSLVVCLAKGIVPIYFVEAALWGALAWFWHKKSPTNQLLNAGIVLLAVIVAAAQGFQISRQPSQSQTDPSASFWQPAQTYTSVQTGNPELRNPATPRKFDRADALMHLGPRKLILGCGTPTSDERVQLTAKFVKRELTYRGIDGSTIVIAFMKLEDNGDENGDGTWGIYDMSSGSTDYHLTSRSDLEQLFMQLPCIPE